jgi:hypothetical protein
VQNLASHTHGSFQAVSGYHAVARPSQQVLARAQMYFTAQLRGYDVRAALYHTVHAHFRAVWCASVARTAKEHQRKCQA